MQLILRKAVPLMYLNIKGGIVLWHLFKFKKKELESFTNERSHVWNVHFAIKWMTYIFFLVADHPTECCTAKAGEESSSRQDQKLKPCTSSFVLAWLDDSSSKRETGQQKSLSHSRRHFSFLLSGAKNSDSWELFQQSNKKSPFLDSW